MYTFIEIVAYFSAFWVLIRCFEIYSLRKQEMICLPEHLPFVSIIIPARNEEENIRRLLMSLKRLDYPHFEILVSDDNSTDNTVGVTRELDIQVISNGEKPTSWIGKSWACWQAAQLAKGELILFTDADTVHAADSLRRSVSFLKSTNSALISAAQFHRNELWWEKLLGPFFCLLNIGVYSKKESIAHPYAIGQYLLVDKAAYLKAGGHKTIKSDLADDASLAKAIMKQDLMYRLYKGKKLCTIQMYRSFPEFVSGWLRILRLGMQELKPWKVFITIIPVLSLNLQNIFQTSGSVRSFVPLIITLMAFTFLQRIYGKFSLVGIAVFPLSFALFLTLAMTAAIQQALKSPIVWKGRTYNQEVSSG